MGSNAKRAQVAESVKKAVDKAGGLVTVALAVAAVALVVSLVALAVAVKSRPAHA